MSFQQRPWFCPKGAVVSVPIAFVAIVAVLAWLANVDKCLIRRYRNMRNTINVKRPALGNH